MRRLLVLSTLLSLSITCGAQAATLGKARGDLVYSAAPGEVNAPEITYDRQARRFTLADPGATLEVSGPCTLAGATATCPAGRYTTLDVLLGDGDDGLTFTGSDPIDEYLLGNVDGGPGNDVLEVTAFGVKGGEGNDRVTNHSAYYDVEGGEGDDILTGASEILGGPGADTLRGTGEDQLLSGGPGVDTIDGGGGERQVVSFAEATTPVTADVGVEGPMGPEGEQDTVTGVDGVIGGKGDDILTGDAGDNDIDGGAGDDTMVGGEGDDEIEARAGTDRVDAGGGSDEIGDSRNRSTSDAVLDGGAGSDEFKTRDSGARVLGGDDGDSIFIGPRTTQVDAGPGPDAIISRKPLDAGDGISCGTGVDVAKGFGLGLIPADCERIAFQHPKVSAVIDNAVDLSGRTLTVPVPALCYDDCRMKVTLLAGERELARRTVRMKFRKNGTATFELTAKARRQIIKSGRAKVHYDAGRMGLITETFVTFPVP